MHSARGESNAAPEGLGLDVVFFAVEPLHLAVVVFDVDLPPRGPGRNTCEMPPGRQEERGGEGSLLLPVGGKDGALGGKGERVKRQGREGHIEPPQHEAPTGMPEPLLRRGRSCPPAAREGRQERLCGDLGVEMAQGGCGKRARLIPRIVSLPVNPSPLQSKEGTGDAVGADLETGTTVALTIGG